MTAADHFVIPAQSEAVVDVFVERQEYDDFSSEQDYLIEPSDHFKETYPLQMAPSLADIGRSCTSKVRLLIPFPTAVSIKQDAVVGKAEPIEGEPKVLVPEENSEDSDNFHQMRRLTFESKPSLQDEHVMDTKPHTARSTGEADIEHVPAHLTDLFERTSKAISPAEKARIASLRTKFQDTFSRDEWDIGLTDLAEHSIPTGDATRLSNHLGASLWHTPRQKRKQ